MFLVKYIAGSTVIKLCEKGHYFNGHFFLFLFIFRCNLYNFNVISGKFMFIIVLNSVKKTRLFQYRYWANFTVR